MTSILMFIGKQLAIEFWQYIYSVSILALLFTLMYNLNFWLPENPGSVILASLALTVCLSIVLAKLKKVVIDYSGRLSQRAARKFSGRTRVAVKLFSILLIVLLLILLVLWLLFLHDQIVKILFLSVLLHILIKSISP